MTYSPVIVRVLFAGGVAAVLYTNSGWNAATAHPVVAIQSF